jgi:hypothetical protein
MAEPLDYVIPLNERHLRRLSTIALFIGQHAEQRILVSWLEVELSSAPSGLPPARAAFTSHGHPVLWKNLLPGGSDAPTVDFVDTRGFGLRTGATHRVEASCRRSA